MNIYLFVGAYREWRKIATAEDGYASMVVYALDASHPNLFFAHGNAPPTYKPGREEK